MVTMITFYRCEIKSLVFSIEHIPIPDFGLELQWVTKVTAETLLEK